MDTPVELEPGSSVDRFRIEAVLGRGGMATVYLARHVHLETLHAIKVLDLTGAGLHRRLLLEGRTQANLRHPNVVAVSDVVEIGRWLGLVMQYVRGPTLAQLIDARRLTVEQAWDLGRGVLAGVGAAHAAGVVHRDLKPANVLLEIEGGRVTPKITDFGLAKAGAVELSRTRSGATMGTPPYMAPEQVHDARDVDPRADVFALGAIFFELLTGVIAFERGSAFETMQAVTRGDRPDLRALNPLVPEPMARAIDAALIVDRERRCPDIATFSAMWAEAAPTLPPGGPLWGADALAAIEALIPAIAPVLPRSLAAPRPVERRTLGLSEGGGTWTDEPNAPDLGDSLVVEPRVAPTAATELAPPGVDRVNRVGLVAVGALGLAGLALGAIFLFGAPSGPPTVAVGAPSTVSAPPGGVPAPPRAVDLAADPMVAPAPLAILAPALEAIVAPASEAIVAPAPDAIVAPAPTGLPAGAAAPGALTPDRGGVGAAAGASPEVKPPKDPATQAPAALAPSAPATPPPVSPPPAAASVAEAAPSPAQDPPARAPEPDRPAAPKLRVTGNATRVWLRSAAGNFQAGRDAIPPGSYVVHAFFPGDADGIRALELRVAAGDNIVLHCDQEQARCLVTSR